VNDTYIKFWPAEYHAQTAVWAALEVRRRVKDVGEVESVLIQTHEAGYTILGKDREKWRPSTKETADHSLPFIVGMALLRGTIDNGTYSDENLSSPDVLSFLRRIEVREDPELTALYPSRGMANRVTVTTKAGKKLSAEFAVPLGHPLKPMSAADVEAKFRRLCSKALGAKKVEEALYGLRRVEAMTDVAELTDILRVKSRGRP